MTDFRFYAYSDFQLYNESENILPKIFQPYSAKLRQQQIKSPSDDLSTELNVPYTIFEILVAVFAIIGNLMVIIVFQRDKKLRRRTNYYIVSLAMADFLVGLLGVPFAILASVGLPTNLHACLFTVSLLVVLCTISIFCLVAVSVDRYWAILYPMAYSRNVRTKTAIGIISMCWFAGTIVGFLPLFGWHADVDEGQACLFVEVMDYNYLVFLSITTIITPALLLLAFYAHIYRVIIRQLRQIVTMNPIGDNSRRSSASHISFTRTHASSGTMLRVLGAARKRDVKATQNLSIIVLFFMICWIPLYTINCIKAFCPTCYVHPKLTFFCIILSHLNSAVNPILYAYHLKDFRAALKNLILKILGIEIEQQPDLAYRASLASQQRLHSIIDKRTSLHNRMYIDSPIWLRQQQQQLKESPRKPTITHTLNSVHQTVAAVASATTEINRDIWKIPETSNNLDDSPKYNNEITTEISSYPIDCGTPNMEVDHQSSYDNKNYSSSFNDLDDEVFLPTTTDDRSLEQLNNTSDTYDDIDLHIDEDSLNAYNNKKYSIPDSLSDYENSCYSIVQQQQQRNLIFPVSSETSVLGSNRTLNGNINIPIKDFTSIKDVEDLRTSTTMQHNNSVFVIENDTNLLSPDCKPHIRKISRIPSPFLTKPEKITRSCSYTNDKKLMDNSEKFSPFKVVSNMIFPPVKHSSLFHIFDSYMNNNEHNVEKKRRRKSDS